MVGVSCWSYEREGMVKSRIYASGDMGGLIPIYDHDYDNTQEPNTILVGEEEEEDSVDMEQTCWDNNAPRLLHTDLSPLYKYIFSDTFSDPTLKTAEGESVIEDFRAQLQHLLPTENEEDASGSMKKEGVKTLFDMHRPQHLFDDLSGLSTSLNTLLSETNDSKVEVMRNLVPISEGFPFCEEQGHEDEGEEENNDRTDNDIPSLYSHLFTSYVAPLPPRIPIRVRLHRERLARMIATEIYLASHGILTNPDPTTATPEQTSASTPDAQEYPPPLFTALQKYTPLRNHFPPSTLSSSHPRILDQWSIGEDPDDFEYEADGAPMPKKAHSKPPRSRSRRGKGGAGVKEEKESSGEGDAGRRVPMFSGTQPVIFAVSTTAQPATPSRGLVHGGGASQTPWAPGTRVQSPEKNSTARVVGESMSQVERGKFGGRKRPPAKKRKQGF